MGSQCRDTSEPGWLGFSIPPPWLQSSRGCSRAAGEGSSQLPNHCWGEPPAWAVPAVAAPPGSCSLSRSHPVLPGGKFPQEKGFFFLPSEHGGETPPPLRPGYL